MVAGGTGRAGEEVTPAQVALAWVLAQGRHVVPVPGARRERYGREGGSSTAEKAGAAGLRLSARDLAKVAELPAAQGSWD